MLGRSTLIQYVFLGSSVSSGEAIDLPLGRMCLLRNTVPVPVGGKATLRSDPDAAPGKMKLVAE